MREWTEPPDTDPICETHHCPLFPARAIPCPECEYEADEQDADDRCGDPKGDQAW